MSARPLIVFDVNEMLFDLETMEPTFERILGDRQAMRPWFANFIMYTPELDRIGPERQDGGGTLVSCACRGVAGHSPSNAEDAHV